MNKYIIHSGNNSRLLIKPLLDQRGNWSEASEQEAESFKAQFIWKPTVYHVRVIPIQAYNQMDELFSTGFGTMIHNHLENNREITTKTGLIRSLRNFYQSNELAIKATYHVHDTIPTSFIITAQVEDEEYRLLVNRCNDIQNGNCCKEKLPAKHCTQNMWLVKPAALNQGRGIEVCRSIKEINTFLKGKLPHSLWLVQKYVERPLLFKGRKFDIRVWAVATGKHDLFYYKHGYLRTSSSEYDPNATDNYIHLTNNCLQKYGDNYGVFEKGNTLPFQAFQEYLDKVFPHYGIDFWSHILPRIKDLIIDSYLSGKKQMLKGKRAKVFELFGYDFLIDEDFRVWLIEVNTNPYLGIPNEYMEGLLPNMLDDMLAIVLDTHIPPKVARPRRENDFELLYCEVASLFSPDGTSKNFRQPYSASLYPVEALAQLPLSKHRSEEEVHVPGPEPRPVVRDLLQTVKEEMDCTMSRDAGDFEVLCSRVMSQLNNWELMSEEQVSNGLQALQALCGSLAAGTFVIYGHLPGILNFCVSEDVPCYLQLGALEAVTLACHDVRFRKEILKLGISESLVNLALGAETEASLKMTALKAMIAISSNLAKKFYIPGETREYNWIRVKIAHDGILLAFFKLGKDRDQEISSRVAALLQSEFGLADWENMICVLNRVIDNNSSARNHRAQSFRVSTESYVSAFTKDIEPKIPSILNNKDFLFEARNEISNFLDGKREEIRVKAEREKQKKLESEEMKNRIREMEDRESEEKQRKVEEYTKKRYDEIKKQKLEEIKKQKESRLNDDKFDTMKKQLIIEKCKKSEEIKRIQRAKLKKQEENLKKIEEEKKREIEEKRKKVLEEWLRTKVEKEKEKKIQDKIKRDEELQRREIEYQIRKEEIIQKIEEKKKVKKVKDDKKDKKRPEGLLAEEASRDLLEKEDISRNVFFGNIMIPARNSPVMKDWRLKKKKVLEKKKKVLNSAPNQFLFEVYANQKN